MIGFSIMISQEGQEAPSPYILYGPHGYQTYPHSRLEESLHNCHELWLTVLYCTELYCTVRFCTALYRCQEVPTVDVEINELQGDWWLQEYVNSHDGKPIGR